MSAPLPAVGCQAYGWLGYCMELPTAPVTGGCVHEHVKVRHLCAAHAASAAAAFCGECKDAGHDCPVRFAVPS